ncbi:hypothetical protein FA95DRAFT_1482636 [Auriscalpium vulgare]|uniref:Uncharacterized protein n=1 Tax=Auriscalpium vulgare TaxID=40419 RepID=A0ACB8S8D6_9AGAM|nr:hypothetical protein FA95DRAFT_1482636 [Auriscalpium vulgare]
MSAAENVPKAVLYYDPKSVCEEKGYGADELDLKIVDLSVGENFSSAFLRLNPKGTVPTMVVPMQNTLSADTESRYKAVTDVEAIITLLDRSRSAISRTHTTSDAPAPALSPATIALSAVAKSIITLLHSSPAAPELLFYLNARDSAELQRVAPTIASFLKGRLDGLERFIAENEINEVRVSERTKGFWMEKKKSTEDLLTALKDASKAEAELDAAGKAARDEYFANTKAAWEVGLSVVLTKLSQQLVGPFALGEQISVVDVHLAAWLAWLVELSGGSTQDSGAVAIAKLEEHVGGGFALPKDTVAPGARATGSEAATPTQAATAPAAKLAVIWDTVKERPSWQKILGTRA